jgi:ubiquitin-protein ligase
VERSEQLGMNVLDLALSRIYPSPNSSNADQDTAFTVRYEESNIRDIQAIIVGPPGTPYELGFYEVISPSLGNLNYAQH